jgi:hypothetical protein
MMFLGRRASRSLFSGSYLSFIALLPCVLLCASAAALKTYAGELESSNSALSRGLFTFATYLERVSQTNNVRAAICPVLAHMTHRDPATCDNIHSISVQDINSVGALLVPFKQMSVFLPVENHRHAQAIQHAICAFRRMIGIPPRSSSSIEADMLQSGRVDNYTKVIGDAGGSMMAEAPRGSTSILMVVCGLQGMCICRAHSAAQRQQPPQGCTTLSGASKERGA